MRKLIDRVLIDRQRIAARVDELAARIVEDFADARAAPGEPDVEPEPLTLVPLLTGSIIFLADLMRRLPVMMRINLLSVSSYPGKSTTSQGVTVGDELPEDLTGRHVLIVDDILDSGRTITAVRELVQQRGATTVRVCVLLRKQIPTAMAVPADYVGFDIPDDFVVGYGLDYDGYFRNLPEVVTLKREALE
jgi:hypoxanthine phosphoribosyltransferase